MRLCSASHYQIPDDRLRPRFQSWLAPPLVVLNNTFGRRGYDSAIKRWILPGGFSICLSEPNAPGKFKNIVHQDNGLPTISVIWLLCMMLPFDPTAWISSPSSISLSLHSWRLILPISGFEFGLGLSDAKHKLSETSSKDLFSSKDNPIDTRTRTMVGVIPYPNRRYQQNKC